MYKFGIGAAAAAGTVALAFSTAYNNYCKEDTKSDTKALESDVHISPRYCRTRQIGENISLKEAIRKSRDLIQRRKDETGAPGIVVGVSINGKIVWQEGLGHSDIENRVPCSYQTVMRIASISKSFTAIATAKLWEESKLDLDKPVKEYLPDYPQKIFNNEKVDITCRHLLSHLSGIRHYNKALPGRNDGTKSKEYGLKEFLIKDKFNTVNDSLVLFKDDPLHYKPGTQYLYTTHGYTLLSAVIEKLVGEAFPVHMTKMFQQLGMKHTFLDVNDSFIYHRSHYYSKKENGQLINAPFVDNSYKWAGGGFLSTVGDLLKFANAVLYSAQASPINNDSKHLPGFLKQETMRMLWSIAVDPSMKGGEGYTSYGMGWVINPEEQKYGSCKYQPHHVYHTGGAVGASSVLLILPTSSDKFLPCGVSVAILTNLQEVKLSRTALEIAELFQNVKSKKVNYYS